MSKVGSEVPRSHFLLGVPAPFSFPTRVVNDKDVVIQGGLLELPPGTQPVRHAPAILEDPPRQVHFDFTVPLPALMFDMTNLVGHNEVDAILQRRRS